MSQQLEIVRTKGLILLITRGSFARLAITERAGAFASQIEHADVFGRAIHSDASEERNPFIGLKVGLTQLYKIFLQVLHHQGYPGASHASLSQSMCSCAIEKFGIFAIVGFLTKVATNYLCLLSGRARNADERRRTPRRNCNAACKKRL